MHVRPSDVRTSGAITAYSKGSRRQTIGEIPLCLTASTLQMSLRPIPESSSPPSPEIMSTRVVTEGCSTYTEAELIVTLSEPDYSVYPDSTVVPSLDTTG